MRRLGRGVGALVAAFLMAMPSVLAAPAPPANDLRANATVIASLPATIHASSIGATESPSDPKNCLYDSQTHPLATVWYSYQPSVTATVEITLVGDMLAVYRGSSLVRCVAGLTGQDVVNLQLAAGARYVIMIAGLTGGYRYTLSLTQPPPPANDAFANATPIPGKGRLNATLDLDNATREPDEPDPSCGGSANATAWFRFTPTKDTSAAAVESGDGAVLVVLTGSSLGSLTQVACRIGGGYEAPVHFDATGGTTYWIQVEQPGSMGSQLFQFAAGDTPDAYFTISPKSPTVSGGATLQDATFDPLGTSRTRTWDFGDGTPVKHTASVFHRWTSSGTYQVTLTVVANGRTASITRAVTVRATSASTQRPSS
jgi:hypothetical protein